MLARQALALDPDDPFVAYKTGEAYETLGLRSEAIPLIGKALANGYNAYEFEHNPQLAGLRADPKVVSGITRSYLPGAPMYGTATLVALVSAGASAAPEPSGLDRFFHENGEAASHNSAL